MTATPAQALANVQHQSARGPRFGAGQCKMRCRLAYNVPSDGSASAAQAWTCTKFRHTDGSTPPPGALCWWTGGSKGYGHVAISAGNNRIWSTDIKRTGYFDLGDLATPSRAWGQRYMGWTEDIDGVHVLHVDAHVPAKQPGLTVPDSKAQILAALAALDKAAPLLKEAMKAANAASKDRTHPTRQAHADDIHEHLLVAAEYVHQAQLIGQEVKK